MKLDKQHRTVPKCRKPAKFAWILPVVSVGSFVEENNSFRQFCYLFSSLIQTATTGKLLMFKRNGQAWMQFTNKSSPLMNLPKHATQTNWTLFWYRILNVPAYMVRPQNIHEFASCGLPMEQCYKPILHETKIQTMSIS